MNTESLAKWAVELSQIEDRIGASQTELRAQLKDGRKEVSFLRERAKRLLGLISGREHEQLALPGAEAPEGEAVHVHVSMDDGEAVKKFVGGREFRDALKERRDGVPNGLNPIAELHRREMVLPKKLASSLRTAERGKGLAGGAPSKAVRIGNAVKKIAKLAPKKKPAKPSKKK